MYKLNKSVVIGVIVVALIFVSSFYSGTVLLKPKVKELKQVTFTMSWVLTGAYAPFYAAVEEGFYRDEGLSIRIQRGFGSGDTVRRVALGESEFGQAAATNVVAGVATGQKVKLIAMQYHRNSMLVYFLTASGIKTPKDLEGKKMAATVGAGTETFWPAFCKVNKIDCNKIEQVAMPSTAKIPAVFTGQADFGTNLLTDLPAVAKLSKETGKPFTYWMFADYGLPNLYGNGIITTDELITKNPELVQAFVRATVRGMSWAVDNPDKAISHFVKYNPQETLDSARETFQSGFRDVVFDGFSEKEGVGFMNSGKMDGTVSLCNEYLDLKRKVNSDEVYVNQFAEKVPKEWRFPQLPPSK